MLTCSICGSHHFTPHKVLWPELISAWQLSAQEAAYIDEQQGYKCDCCSASLRVVALGDALRGAWGTRLTIRQFVQEAEAQTLRILDINGALVLSEALAVLPNYSRADFPEVDLQSLPFSSHAFDIVMHSDTLEHIEQPALALEECRRVLTQEGCLCLTVPLIVGRLTRSRAGLAKSYHGSTTANCDDLLVHTEFGVDAWTFLARAGFSRVMINCVQYPSATAISAWY